MLFIHMFILVSLCKCLWGQHYVIKVSLHYDHLFGFGCSCMLFIWIRTNWATKLACFTQKYLTQWSLWLTISVCCSTSRLGCLSFLWESLVNLKLVKKNCPIIILCSLVNMRDLITIWKAWDGGGVDHKYIQCTQGMLSTVFLE